MNQMLKNILLLLIMSMIAMTAKAQDCLPMNQKKLLRDSNYIVKTVHHPDYNQAEAMLKQELPSSGFHQHLKAQEVKELTKHSYNEQRKLETNLNANIDHWIKYSCHHRGDYYITAVIGKDDINYFDLKNYDAPKEINIKYIKNFCKGYEKIVVTYGTADIVKAEKKKRFRLNATTLSWHIACGSTQVTSAFSEHITVSNEFDSFLFVTEGDNTDRTIALWLELTKSIQ